MMWSEVDTWFTAQKLTMWDVFLHGFCPPHTHIHAYIYSYNQFNYVCNFFNFTPPDTENNT